VRVSVIVPVYNAEPYLRQAVESALAQPETGEVILVEDASPDGALALCRELAEASERVRLFRHPHGENRGAGASRNLGIRQASCEFVAFLDADDYYLPGHFAVPREIFAAHPEADGVYEAVGTHFEDEEAKRKWFAVRDFTLTTVRRKVPPEELLGELLADNRCSWFHTDGITVRRSLLGRTGLFDEHLRVKQDIVLYRKMAAVGTLLPGRLDEPVSMRRVHAGNRWMVDPAQQGEYMLLVRRTLAEWVCDRWRRPEVGLSKQRAELLLARYLSSQFPVYRDRPFLARKRGQFGALLPLLARDLQVVQLGCFRAFLTVALGIHPPAVPERWRRWLPFARRRRSAPPRHSSDN